MAKKCKIGDCGKEATWSMQPFGPDERIAFSLFGSHYRGFPTIAVCDDCKNQIQSDTIHPFYFIYKMWQYRIVNGEVVYPPYRIG
jgi:hypothetical protein